MSNLYVDEHDYNCAHVMKHKEITVQDCDELREKFVKYTETAEQHEFPRLAMVNFMLDETLPQLRATGVVKNQREARAMFRIVLKTIGEDASEYEEVEG